MPLHGVPTGLILPAQQRASEVYPHLRCR